MLSLLRRARSPRDARLARAPHKARMALETLEDRSVPTVVFVPHFGPQTVQGSNDGMQNPNVYLIFSGSYWSTSQGQANETTLTASAQNILSGPYLSGLRQYGSDGRATFANSWTEAGTVPSQPSIDDMQTFLQGTISAHGAAPGFNDAQHAPIYVVVSDPASSAQYNGGWNAPGTYFYQIGFFHIPANMHMIWVGTSSTSGGAVWKDAYTLTLSHELAETISDPDSNGITVTAPPGLPNNVKGDNQIGDNEPEPGGQPHYGYRLGGVVGDLVQPYWSRADNAFIVPDGNAQNFYLYPIWNGSSFTGTYNLNVQGDQLGTNYNDVIRVDNLANKSAQVKENNETVDFDPGSVKTINVNTQGGNNFVKVAGLPAGVVLNLDSSGRSNDYVFVGDDHGSLSSIQGTVNVSNTSGQTDLVIDAYADGGRNIDVTDHSVSFSGLTTINYTGGTRWKDGSLHEVTELQVIDGHGHNNIRVDSVPALTDVIIWGQFFDTLSGPAAGQVHMHRAHLLIR